MGRIDTLPTSVRDSLAGLSTKAGFLPPNPRKSSAPLSRKKANYFLVYCKKIILMYHFIS
jgi:hypothetical protein